MHVGPLPIGTVICVPGYTLLLHRFEDTAMGAAIVETVFLVVFLAWETIVSVFIIFLVWRGWGHLSHIALIAVNLVIATSLHGIFNDTYWIYRYIDNDWKVDVGTCRFVLTMKEFGQALLPMTMMFLCGDTMKLTKSPFNYIKNMTTFTLYDKVVAPWLLSGLITLVIMLNTAHPGINQRHVCLLELGGHAHRYKLATSLAHYVIPLLFNLAFTIASALYFVRLWQSAKPTHDIRPSINSRWILGHCIPVWAITGLWVVLSGVSAYRDLRGVFHENDEGLEEDVLEEVSAWCCRLFVVIIPAWWLCALPDARRLVLLQVRKQPADVASSLVTVVSVL